MNIWIVTYNDDEGVSSVPFYSETAAINAATAWVRHYFETDFDHLSMPDDWCEAYDLLSEQSGFMDTIKVTSVPLAPAFEGVTRAHLMDFGNMERDTSGNPCVWLNEYRCDGGVDEPTHDEEWEDAWSCQCEDQCPTCGRSVEPHTSHFLPSVPAPLAALWGILAEA